MIPMPRLELDEENHIYTLNGRRLMSVTQALALVDNRNHKYIDPFYLKRGRMIHLACEYYDRGELDESTIDPQIDPYLKGYIKFLDETGFIPDRRYIEIKLYHPQYIYAGRIDRIGLLNKNNDLIDLKSGAKARVDELQGAAYWELCRVNNILIKKVFDLYLKDDGTYKLEPVDNPKLLVPTFLNILGAARWKENL